MEINRTELPVGTAGAEVDGVVLRAVLAVPPDTLDRLYTTHIALEEDNTHTHTGL